MGKLNDVPPLLIKIIDRLQTAETLSLLALTGERIIKKRTREGKDVEGRTFQDYALSYKEKRRLAKLPVSPVTLTWDDISGMMQRVDHEVAADLKSVSLYFTDPRKAKLAYYHSESGVGKKGKNIRRFWDFSEKEKNRIIEVANDRLDLVLQDLSAEFNMKL